MIKQMGGLAVKVGIDDRPTAAGYGLPDVEAMLAWLDQLQTTEGASA